MGVGTIATLIKLLPEFLKIAKSANEKVKSGVTINEIKKALRQVDDAFNIKDVKKGVDILNDTWDDSNIH